MIVRRSIAVVCCILVLNATPVFAKQPAKFKYNDHGKRDPFKPLVSSDGILNISEADMVVTDMNVEGIVADPTGNNMAIINSKIVKAGDQIGSYQIEAIYEDHVVLIKDQQRFSLRFLKKGGG